MQQATATDDETTEESNPIAKHRDVTENTSLAEKREADTRVCDLCKEDVEGGLDAMFEHISNDHDPADIAKELSHEWRTGEPLVFHHPSAKTHFIGSGGYAKHFVTTICGMEVTSDDLDVDVESIQEFTSYDHVDEDEYCESCVNLYLQETAGVGVLPAPLQEADGE